MKHFMSVLALMLVLATVAPRGVHASPESRVAANLMTMTEATLSTASFVLGRTNGKVQEFSWRGNYSERDWLIRAGGIIDGEPISFTLSGYLWGQDKENWIVQYSGLGTRGKQKEPVQVNGKADWIFDKEISDYRDMDFRQVVKFGENSRREWIVGAEIIGGAVIGGGTGFVATGGVGLILGILGGVEAATSISSNIKSTIESDKPVDPPKLPKRPAPPKEKEWFAPRAGLILVAVARDGRIWGSGPEGILIISGTYNNDDNSVEGTIRMR